LFFCRTGGDILPVGADCSSLQCLWSVAAISQVLLGVNEGRGDSHSYEAPPLLRQITTFGCWLTVGVTVLAGLTFGFALLAQSYSATDLFLAAVGLAVATILQMCFGNPAHSTM
jgi:hypothetical protein